MTKMTKKSLIAKSRRTSQFVELRNKTKLKRRKSNVVEDEAKKIEHHPFYQNVIKWGVIPLWEAYRKSPKDKQEIDLDKELTYHLYVYQYAFALYEAIKRLNDNPFFISQNPSVRLMENKNVATQEWFVYHYANYRVVATGIFDTVLLVINDVLQLGFEPRECRKKDIFNHPKVIERGIVPVLFTFDSTVEKYRMERHKYVHRSERPDLDFVDNLNVYRFMRELKEKGAYKGQLPKQAAAHMYFFEQRDKKITELRAGTIEICKSVTEILDVLNPIYMEMAASFSEENISP